MSQEPIELILTRQLASYLTMPIFLVDDAGNLLYYNEPAEGLLGLRYDETGAMTPEEWGSRWSPVDDDGVPIPVDDLPLVEALRDRTPAHAHMQIAGSDGVARRIGVTAFPLEGQGGRRLGALAIFWPDGA